MLEVKDFSELVPHPLHDSKFRLPNSFGSFGMASWIIGIEPAEVFRDFASTVTFDNHSPERGPGGRFEFVADQTQSLQHQRVSIDR